MCQKTKEPKENYRSGKNLIIHHFLNYRNLDLHLHLTDSIHHKMYYLSTAILTISLLLSSFSSISVELVNAFTIVANPKSGVTTFFDTSSSLLMSSKKNDIPAEKDPEIQAAIAEVRVAAEAFGPDVAAFADKYLNEKLWDGSKSTAIGLLDECLIDWDEENPGEKCRKLEEALVNLDQMIGVLSKDQY